MPPRAKKNPLPAQSSLAAPLPVPAAVFELPRALRYELKSEIGTEPRHGNRQSEIGQWQVERFDLLAAEFAMVVKSQAEAEEAMQRFHGFAAEHPMPWRIARRLFGICPMFPDGATHPDDLRIWTRGELVSEGGWAAGDIGANLNALRVMWRDHVSREEQARQAETSSTALTDGTRGTRPSDELQLDDTLLEKFQFSERIFKINIYDPAEEKEVPRPDSENRVERDWFTGRVRQWQKMLEDPMGAPVARSALMNDLYLRRLEYEMAVSPSNRRDNLQEQQQRMSKDYNTSIEKLQEMFPDLAVAGRINFRAALSDVIIGHRDYYARADRRLVDKVFTSSEIEYQLRSSLQLGAQHRFSLGLAIVENIHGFYDPEFRSQFKPGTLKKIDAMTKAAREAVRELQNEPVVDLERGASPDEPDQYEDFNDEQCTATVSGRPCGAWHPNGKPCPNAKAHD